MNKYNPDIHHRRSIRLKGYDYSQAGLYFITICCQDRKCLFGKIINGEMVLTDAGEIARECWLEIPKHFPNVVLHDYVIMPNHVHGIIEFVGENVGANQYSPENANDHSPENANDHSPENANDHSPESANDHSPESANDHSPENANDDSPENANDDSPENANDHSPENANDHSPENANQNATPNNSSNIVGVKNFDGDENGAGNAGVNNIANNGANIDSPLRSPSKTIGSVVRGFKIGVTKWFHFNTNIQIVWQRNYYEHIIRNEQSYQNISEYIINNPAKWQDDIFYKH
jgi:REP element-mobilizing transposase RayT